VAVQVVVAAALPWLVGRVLAPGEPIWAALAVGATALFAALHARAALVWLLPVSALVSVLPAVGPVPAALLAVAVSLVLLVRPPTDAVTRGSALRWAASGLLLATGVLVAGSALLSLRASDATFEAGQQAAAEAWDSPLIVEPAPGSQAPSSTPPATLGESTGGDESATRDAGEVGPVDTRPDPSGSPVATPDPVFSPRPIARMSFRRPGADGPPVTASPLYVGPNVSEATLTQGPGHYPSTAQPGEDGNFAVAGHRTGWGAPFYLLDELKPGDEVLAVDRQGRRHVYVVDGAEFVEPDASWVLGADPLGTGRPTLTLTTCDPPGVNDRRLVVFATLQG
jgi:LPXTG-site transpeptidase (sortase) family protein